MNEAALSSDFEYRPIPISNRKSTLPTLAARNRLLISLWGQFPEACFVLDWVSVIDTSQLAAG